MVEDPAGQRIGAGEGNRTLVVSLGSFCSAIELHPRIEQLAATEPIDRQPVARWARSGIFREPGSTAGRERQMDLQLRGKRAFVSGSSSGLGAAIAREFADEGVSVVVHGRDRVRAEATAQDIAAKGVPVAVTVGDLTRNDEAQAVARAAVDVFGGIDILVN